MVEVYGLVLIPPFDKSFLSPPTLEDDEPQTARATPATADAKPAADDSLTSVVYSKKVFPLKSFHISRSINGMGIVGPRLHHPL